MYFTTSILAKLSKVILLTTLGKIKYFEVLSGRDLDALIRSLVLQLLPQKEHS